MPLFLLTSTLKFTASFFRLSGCYHANPSTIAKIDQLNNASLGRYIDDAFHNNESAKKMILCDFFRHAFDGSGADNFFDAGSCIDGRLTSAWNWCSQLEKKSYFPLFLLTGFMGFDGQF
jgi:hypothetical protein